MMHPGDHHPRAPPTGDHLHPATDTRHPGRGCCVGRRRHSRHACGAKLLKGRAGFREVGRKGGWGGTGSGGACEKGGGRELMAAIARSFPSPSPSPSPSEGWRGTSRAAVDDDERRGVVVRSWNLKAIWLHGAAGEVR